MTNLWTSEVELDSMSNLMDKVAGLNILQYVENLFILYTTNRPALYQSHLLMIEIYRISYSIWKTPITLNLHTSTLM
jgi:hypothetical protein